MSAASALCRSSDLSFFIACFSFFHCIYIAAAASILFLQENRPVAHSLSAKKRIRQNEKHRARNRARKMLIKDLTRSFGAALQAGDAGKAGVELNKLVGRLDRTAAK